MVALQQLSRLIRATSLHNFWIRAISPCSSPRKPIASHRLIYSHAFVTVTRLRDIARHFHRVLPPRPPLGSRPKKTRRSLYFFFSSPTDALHSVVRGAGVVAPTIFAISRRAIFPARELFAPSAGPLSYFPPGNIAPTRKTIPSRRLRGARRTEGATIGPGEIGEVLSRNNICICERLSSLISSWVFYPD